MSDWKTTPQEMPTPATNCWVRLNYWFGAPFMATYDNVAKEWTSNTGFFVYPHWTISRWKYA